MGTRPIRNVPASIHARLLQRLWAGFLTNALLYTDGPVTLADVGDRIQSFLGPVRSSIFRHRPFRRQWSPGGPWWRVGDEGEKDE